MALVYRPVTGRYLNVDGSPKFGYIEFTPTIDMVSAGEAILPLHTVPMYLDADGYISGELACTDSVGVSPTGWLWSVEEKVENGTIWWMILPIGDSSPYDIISNKSPGLAPPSYGISGPIGPPGDTGPPGPPTAVYVQPDTPSLATPPPYFPLWVDTDEPSTGTPGPPGPPGEDGPPGVGVPTGGTTGQVLAKNSATNYDTGWVSAGGSEVQIPNISGWTQFGSPGAFNTTQFGDGSLYLDTAPGADLSGAIAVTALSFPSTFTFKQTMNNSRGNYQRCGGFVISKAGTVTDAIYAGPAYNNGRRIQVLRYTGTGTYHSNLHDIAEPGLPLWMRVTFTNSTTMSLWYSMDGMLWIPMLTAYGLPFTVAQVGLGGSDEGGGESLARFTKWIQT